MYRVLLADDDHHILKTNETYLTRLGYEVISVDNGADALRAASAAAIDAIVLDVDMPGMDGLAVCRQLRKVSGVPIIFLSAYGKEDDRIRGLMMGGDDYLCKPHSLVELELRIRLRIQRRLNIETREVLRFGELEIDLGMREVRYRGEAATLTSLEFKLVTFLAQNPGQVFSYEQLYDRVWNEPLNKGIHNMQVCMARLRQKLDRLCPGAHYIETVRGEGYRFLKEPKS